ncbi:MAG: DUF1549 domain-containing protein [Planctomycetia bacterium]
MQTPIRTDRNRLWLGLALLVSTTATAAPTPEQLDFFEAKIRPVLARHCQECHSAEAMQAGRLKAGLLVDSRAGLAKGGESGAAVVPGDKAQSLLLAALKHDGFEMPPAGRLPDEVIADFETWIDMGAPDPREEPLPTVDERTIDVAAGRQHWSYRRLAPVAPPQVKAAGWARNDIDRFILARQEEAGIAPAPEAARATLARRVSFDLTGLPPTPEDLAAFLADDAADAYEKLVDRLLASPRFGERQARQWLDTVRFAESGGYEFDGERPSAHHYRDWVIKAFNADLPYDEFLRLQVAGDLVRPGDFDATAATGFLVAGPYPGQVTAKTVEPIRYDQLDDMVSTLGASVLGMTIGCARCHDHKYDPIGHRDYYAMIACLGKAVQRDTGIDLDPAKTHQRREAWLAERAPVVAAADRYRREELPGRVARWLAGEAPRQLVDVTWIALAPQALKSAFKTNLVEEPGSVVAAAGPVELRETYSLTFRTHRRGLRGLRLEALASPTAVGGGPGTGADGGFCLARIRVRAKPLDAAAQQAAVDAQLRAVWATSAAEGYPLEDTLDEAVDTGWSVAGPPGRDHAAVFAFEQPLGFAGGTEITVVLEFAKERPGLSRLRMAVSHAVDDVDLATAAVPQAASELATVLDEARAAGSDPADEAVSAELLRWFARLDAEAGGLAAAVAASDAQEPKPELTKVYSATNGPWVITGNSQGVRSGGEDVFVLARGEVGRKQGRAAPGFVLATIAADDAEQAILAGPGTEPLADSRLGLAAFLADVDRGAGPLAARVIVNRLWHQHFGRGIVGTPNDLGTQGDPPSHPELLEWLANRLVADRWSLKALHRLIVTSATYRQSGAVDEAHRARDPDNRLLWHRKPLRLEGEAIRDALLVVGGMLDETMYGRAGIDVNAPRRSIYLTVKRSEPIGFLQVFDQPEPVQSVGARGVATVPTQALAMLNAPLVRSAAEGLAAKVSGATAAAEPAATIDACFMAALARRPTAAEREKFTALLASRAAAADPAARQAAVADVCQLIFCLNEFVYVD